MAYCSHFSLGSVADRLDCLIFHVSLTALNWEPTDSEQAVFQNFAQDLRQAELLACLAAEGSHPVEGESVFTARCLDQLR